MSSAFDDVLDPKTASKSNHGVSARRKAHLCEMDAPLDTLAHHGIEVPHKNFDPEQAEEFVSDYEPITVTVTGGNSETDHVEPREVPRYGY